MMRGSHRHQSAGGTKGRQPIALGEICHEIRNARAGWRLVPTNRNVVLGLRTPFTRHHHELAAGATDAQHVLGRALVELAMQPTLKIRRGRLAKLPFRGQAVDLGL